MDKLINKLELIVESILTYIVVAIMMAIPLMWLWNWLMPVIFGLPTITLLQAWGLSFLSSMLIKSNNVNK